jgi:uncharacterized protein
VNIHIDIGHPAHVYYFRNFIKLFLEKNHKISITARDKDVTLSLLNKYELNYTNRGKGAKSFFGKLAYMLIGDQRVYKVAKKNRAEILISFGSPYAAQAAWLLGKPHIVFDDTEAATFGHLMYKPFSDLFVNPRAFKKKFGKNQIFFDGFMELCHLHPKYFKPDEGVYRELNIERDTRYFLLRFVSWDANHDIGQTGIPNKDKIEIIKFLTIYGKIFISSESKLPKELEPYRLKTPPDRIHHVMAFADLYIGEGATMASECAMLGTPSIYVNSISAGTIEAQKKYGLISTPKDSQELFDMARDILDNSFSKDQFQIRRHKMLGETIDVTAFMVWLIENYPVSVNIIKENPNYQERFR